MTVRHAPIHVADLDLSRPIAPAVPREAAGVRFVVRLHGHPLGVVDATPEDVGADRLPSMVWAAAGEAIASHTRAWHGVAVAGLDELHTHNMDPAACSWHAAANTRPAPSATIVVNTCAASEPLRRTLISAFAQDYPDFNVVVVDNRPATSGVTGLLRTAFGEEPRLTYVAETAPGLGRARNAGLRSTTSSVVAFTDDDVVLDESWLGWLVAGFSAASDVACVTGLIVPLELETPAQVMVEAFSGFGKGFEQRVWDRDGHRLSHPLYPYTVGLFGSGASAAFWRDALLELGGFDPYLGIGTPAVGGEDIDMYTRMVLAGHRIVYQPASLLRHQHRRDMESVNRQIRGYGAGLTAMLTKHVVTGSATRREVLRRIPAGVGYALSSRSPKNARKPPEFGWRQSALEWFGMAYGPIGYLRSRLAG